MEKMLAMLCVIDWFANDMHYQSRGRGFYEKHLLADRVRDFGSAADDIKEGYFLGYKKENPPKDIEICEMAQYIYEKTCSEKQDMLDRLEMIFGILSVQVEDCKKEPGLPAGVHAILDEISKRALTYKFLVMAEAGH